MTEKNAPAKPKRQPSHAERIGQLERRIERVLRDQHQAVVETAIANVLARSRAAERVAAGDQRQAIGNGLATQQPGGVHADTGYAPRHM